MATRMLPVRDCPKTPDSVSEMSEMCTKANTLYTYHRFERGYSLQPLTQRSSKLFVFCVIRGLNGEAGGG